MKGLLDILPAGASLGSRRDGVTDIIREVPASTASCNSPEVHSYWESSSWASRTFHQTGKFVQLRRSRKERMSSVMLLLKINTIFFNKLDFNLNLGQHCAFEKFRYGILSDNCCFFFSGDKRRIMTSIRAN